MKTTDIGQNFRKTLLDTLSFQYSQFRKYLQWSANLSHSALPFSAVYFIKLLLQVTFLSLPQWPFPQRNPSFCYLRPSGTHPSQNLKLIRPLGRSHAQSHRQGPRGRECSKVAQSKKEFRKIFWVAVFKSFFAAVHTG